MGLRPPALLPAGSVAAAAAVFPSRPGGCPLLRHERGLFRVDCDHPSDVSICGPPDWCDHPSDLITGGPPEWCDHPSDVITWPMDPTSYHEAVREKVTHVIW